MLYQTLLGAWPLEKEDEPGFLPRVQEFLKKALREAKVHSSWIRPDEVYEDAVLRFVHNIFQSGVGAFGEGFLRLQKQVAWHGALNSLSQVLIKITSPGLPDLYQGSELWDLSMVDPDNRRPVDFKRRIQMLEEIRKAQSEKPRPFLKEILSFWQDGRVKLYLTDRTLEFRRANIDLYQEGAYIPLVAEGEKSACLCAYARQKGKRWCITIAPILTTRLAPAGRMPLGRKAWLSTSLLLPKSAPTRWHNALTGEALTTVRADDGQKILSLADVMKRFPVALLSAVP